MKNLIKKGTLLVLLVTMSLTAKAFDKAMQAKNGEVELNVFKYVLRNRTTGILQRNVWNKISVTDPQTGNRIFQEVYIWAYLPAYMPKIVTEAQINGIHVKPFSSVKVGSYRNNGYDLNGMKQPLRPDYIPILVNFNYFCDADGVAIAKTNCANEQDWLEPYTPKPTPYEPVAPKGEFMFVPCANVNVEMEPKDPSKTFQLSKGGAYALRNGVWYYYTGIAGQEYKKLTCEPPQATHTNTVIRETQVVYVDRPVQTMNALYQQQPVQQCCPQERQRSYVGVGIALSFVNAFAPMLYQQPQYTNYQPYTPNQPVQWGGTMSNGGSGGYYTTGDPSNGGSGGYTNGGTQSNGGGISNGGSSNGGVGNAGQWTIIPRQW